MDHQEIDPAFGHWLAGFADGEGCFYVQRMSQANGNKTYSCRFTIVLRDDDAPALLAIKRELGFGAVITRQTPKSNDKPQALYRVYRKADCLRLVYEVFDAFPLRAKKARDYVLWREAVFAWQDARPGGTADNSATWARMAELQQLMSEGRKYRDR